MPFALDFEPTNSEMAEAINYLLANFGPNISADPNTGVITGPTGIVVGYLYKYMSIKYADSADGSVNFSNSPTNRLYYGLRNSDETTESTNPADYIWYKVAGGGFSTTKFLFYQTIGGRNIQFVVSTASPGTGWAQDDGAVIDLDIITAVTLTAAATPTIYQWTSSSTPPARPTTTTTYYWSTGVYTAPLGWSTVPPSNTTPGSYLWAISIPIIADSTTETSILDWTNGSYPIRAISYNGMDGATGSNGLSAITAYLVQSQSAANPTGFPQTTSGSTAPSGWSLTAPSVAVGQVLWYSQGQYNSGTTTISGIAPNTTYWNNPVAASIFQDIRSDNWNGSTPPTYGTPATYGTTGYYIQRNTGDVFFNNGVYRGDISTDGDAYFEGKTQTTAQIPFGSSTYYADYSSYSYAITNASSSSVLRVGVLGQSNATTSYANIGILGQASNTSKGFGVAGVGGWIGGYFYGSGNSSTAIYAESYNASTYALQLVGPMATTNSARVVNLYSDYTRTMVGTASNQLRFVGGTTTGTATATFNSANKPGSNSTNTWIAMQVDSTTVYIPVWS